MKLGNKKISSIEEIDENNSTCCEIKDACPNMHNKINNLTIIVPKLIGYI